MDLGIAAWIGVQQGNEENETIIDNKHQRYKSLKSWMDTNISQHDVQCDRGEKTLFAVIKEYRKASKFHKERVVRQHQRERDWWPPPWRVEDFCVVVAYQTSHLKCKEHKLSASLTWDMSNIEEWRIVIFHRGQSVKWTLHS